MTMTDALRRGAVVVFVLAAMTGTADRALAAKPNARTRAAVLQAVVDCRQVTEADKRLACFDAAAAKLDQAEATGQVVVVDSNQVREVKRDIFGLSLPSLDLFGPLGIGKSSAANDIDHVAEAVKTASRLGNGRWVVELDSGAVWRQIDDEPVDEAPRRGTKAVIRRASLGSYFMKLDGQRSIRVMRDR